MKDDKFRYGIWSTFWGS